MNGKKEQTFILVWKSFSRLKKIPGIAAEEQMKGASIHSNHTTRKKKTKGTRLHITQQSTLTLF